MERDIGMSSSHMQREGGQESVTTTKKRKFNQISTTTQQLETLKLDRVSSEHDYGYKRLNSQDSQFSELQNGNATKRRRLNEIGNILMGSGKKDSMQSEKYLIRSNSKDKTPFKLLATANSVINIQRINSKERSDYNSQYQFENISKQSGKRFHTQTKQHAFNYKENQQLLSNQMQQKNYLSPSKRMSHISERAEMMTYSNDDRTHGRKTASLQKEKLQPLDSPQFEVDEISELAQIGTPGTPESMKYLTQSPIKQDEKMSEVSSQLDFIAQFLDQAQKRNGANKNPYCNLSQQDSQNFALPELNEYDSEYENPLNKAMVIERTATDFKWSKQKDESDKIVQKLKNDKLNNSCEF